MSTKIAIVGSRDFPDLTMVSDFINKLPRDTIIISGGAQGVDHMAEISALVRNIQIIVIKPDWKRHGRAAGPIRNGQIVAAADAICAWWTGRSQGTLDIIKKAACAGKGVRIFGPPQPAPIEVA